jgi:lipopolysaccharide/colanic/teichoic acid biosynthesis glycosyltransferase
MELALQGPAIALESPSAKPAVIYTNYILRIANQSGSSEADCNLEHILFSTVTAKEAIARLHADDETVPDAILLGPDCADADAISDLSTAARERAIPLILYTPKYDKTVKSIAFSIMADEYHYGAITPAFLRRLGFLKKLKAYKNERGNKPYATRHVDQVPHIELWTMKRAFDILISGTALLILLPICLLIALIIKLESKGPIFYISKRAGTGYRIFNFYKFRTMRDGADSELTKLAHLNQYSENSTDGVFFKIKDDPRITKFGQFLRNTSLDEIPQLFNVLTGDMSLVGNRPLPLYEAEKLTRDQIAWRFLAPAGITGLWQITKRGKDNMSPDERIALDMEYAMKNSFWLDMKILLSTFPALLQKEKV